MAQLRRQFLFGKKEEEKETKREAISLMAERIKETIFLVHSTKSPRVNLLSALILLLAY